jgi:hypothetical protein
MSAASSAALPGNEIKLLGKGPVPAGPPLTGRLALQGAAPQPGHDEEDR